MAIRKGRSRVRRLIVRLLVGVVLLGLVGGGLALYGWGTRPAGPKFQTAAVRRGDLLATASATGTIEPEEVIDVGAQVVGMIKEFGRDPDNTSRPIDYGSRVEKDTVLAQIDSTLYESQVQQAEANVQRARADLGQLKAKLSQADRDFTRNQRARRTGAVSESDLDLAQANFETARSALAVGEAGVAQAEAALRQAKINFGYTTIKSPVRGVIVDRRVNIGQTVVSSLNAPSLFLIATDLKRLQVWASVNEADIGRIHKGVPVRFGVDAYPGDVFRGVVDQVRLNATMTQNVVTYTVVVTTDNADGRLLPYMTANLKFEIDTRKDVVTVPNAALRWQPLPGQIAPDARPAGGSAERKGKKGGGPGGKGDEVRQDRGVVWVQDDGYVRPVEVRTGLSDGLVTEIVGGELAEGQAVVLGEVAEADSGTSNPFTPKMFGGGKR